MDAKWIAPVVGIIGLCVALALSARVRSQPYLFTANRKVVEADLQALAEALEQFALQNAGKYPTSLNEIIDRIVSDPWRHPYVYTETEGGFGYQLMSYGADGMPGG